MRIVYKIHRSDFAHCGLAINWSAWQRSLRTEAGLPIRHKNHLTTVTATVDFSFERAGLSAMCSGIQNNQLPPINPGRHAVGPGYSRLPSKYGNNLPPLLTDQSPAKRTSGLSYHMVRLLYIRVTAPYFNRKIGEQQQRSWIYRNQWHVSLT